MTKREDYERRAREGASQVAQAYQPEAQAAGRELGLAFAKEVDALEAAEREHYSEALPDMLMRLAQSVPVGHKSNRPADMAGIFYDAALQAFGEGVRTRL